MISAVRRWWRRRFPSTAYHCVLCGREFTRRGWGERWPIDGSYARHCIAWHPERVTGDRMGARIVTLPDGYWQQVVSGLGESGSGE